MDKGSYSGYRDLKAYRMTYDLALEIQQVTKTFPKEEKFALTDQIRRSSRSVPANLDGLVKSPFHPSIPQGERIM